MSFTIVQQATPLEVLPGTTGTVQLTGVTAGNQLIIVCSGDSTTITQACSDSQSQTVHIACQGNASQGNYSIFYIENAASGTHTETVTSSVSQNYGALMIEVSGMPTSSTFDAASTIATGFGTAIAANAVTPAASGEFAVVVLGADSFNPTLSSWTSPLAGLTRSNGYTYGATATLASGSAFTAQATWASSSDFIIATALFKAAAGGGGPTPTYYYLGSQNFY